MRDGCERSGLRIASSRRSAGVSKMRGPVLELGGCSSHNVDEHMVQQPTCVEQIRPNEEQICPQE